MDHRPVRLAPEDGGGLYEPPPPQPPPPSVDDSLNRINKTLVSIDYTLRRIADALERAYPKA